MIKVDAALTIISTFNTIFSLFSLNYNSNLSKLLGKYSVYIPNFL